MSSWSLLLVVLVSVCPALGQTAPAAQSGAKDNPILQHRPAEPQQPAQQRRVIQLDVEASDAAGKPVVGLQPWDFKLLDNGRADKIVYFRAFDGVTVKPDPPAQVILVLDFMNLGLQQQAFARDELKRFFAQGTAELPEPVTIMVLTDKGLAVQPQPSRDPRALSALVDKIHPQITAFSASMGFQGAIERFNRSVRQIRFIAENERHKEGRKLLLWIGPGWPVLDRRNTIQADNNQTQYFRAIVELSGWLREAQMVLYSIPPLDSSMGALGRSDILYQNFLKPVLTAKEADSGNLALGVLAAETGGDTLVPSNDLVGKIEKCIASADSYYQLTVEVPPAEHADEYHALTLSVNQPGVRLRTNTGYYDQPPTP